MSSNKNPRFFLIDGSALIYRSFFAFINNPLINSKGVNTSAVYGFLRFLFKIQDEEKPDYFAVCFDTPEPTFRHKAYKEYKATREKMPDELREQIPQVRSIINALNIPILEMPGYEADDVMATLALRAKNDGIETRLVTGDKDLMQLVCDEIKLYNLRRTGDAAEIYDSEAVKAKMGVPPAQIRDYLALVGDTSDNVPGVPKVGAKTAVGLLEQYGSLEGVYEQVESITKKAVKQSLIENKEKALLSQELVTLDTAVPIELTWDALAENEPDGQQVVKLLQEFEFNSLVERFTGQQSRVKDVDYQTIKTKAEFEYLIKKIKKTGRMTFDLETTSADPMQAEIVGFSFSMEEAEAFYLPVAEAESEAERFDAIKLQDDGFNLKPLLEEIFTDAAIEKNGQNAKYDMTVLKNYGIDVNGLTFDTMLASYLLNPTLRQHNLDALALEHLNISKVPTSDLIGSGKSQITMREVPVEKVAYYACEDADVTERLRRLFEPKLVSAGMKKLADEIEIPLIYTLLEVERNGVALDLDFLRDMSKEMERELQNLEAHIHRIAGEEFNIASPKQLGVILFEKLGLPAIKKTKTGYSTDASVLEQLAIQHELPQEIIAFREISKLKNTYIDALPLLMNSRTGRLHTSYNQTVAATGRLSSADPNLQNIPIRTELGRRIRKAFVPEKKGWVILDADYSQIELRIMAHLSGDKALQQAFQTKEDIHVATAARVFNVEKNAVTADFRRKAKEVNFGIMYGMGAFGLASRLRIAQNEARSIIEEYFAQYPGVGKYIDDTLKHAQKNGYVTTMLGRRRLVPEINSKNRRVREFAERTAVNTPIQGTAADMIKIAMNNVSARMKKEKVTSKMIMQVHDELVFEVPEQEIEKMQKIVREEMENALPLDVPIVVEGGVGKDWLEAH